MLKTLILPAAALLLSACTATLAQTSPESSSAMVDQTPLTIERLFASPSLSGPAPSGVKYSPDGSRVTFLKARDNDVSRYDLWQFDVATGEQSMLVDSTLLEPEEVELSEEEKALRERKRIAGRKGIVDYDWGTANTILVPLGGDLHLITLTENGSQARQLTQTDAFEYDAKVSPGGNYVSFIRDGAVYAIDLASSEERLLTPLADPDNAIAYGVAEFVAQEEMDRYTGYWWSPDDRYLAYTKVDESTVDVIPRFDIAAENVTVINQRYPRAGRPNAIVDLYVRDMATGESTKINWHRDDWGPATDQYLARVYFKNGRTGGENLFIGRINRDQTDYDMTTVRMPDSSDGGTVSTEPAYVFTETHETWINLQAPEDTFAAAFAGAPVTDWTLYDTFYTERYMDTPQDNADGYEKSSVFYHLERLETELPHLMLAHGMADDNVTFDNTTRLMAELQQRGIVFDLMTYPGQRHGIRGQALGTHLMKTRMAFLDRHLK